MSTTAEPTITMTVRLSPAIKDDFDALSRATGRNRNALIQEALQRFLDAQRWQIARIQEGLRQAEAGQFVSDAEMEEMWAEFGGAPADAVDEQRAL